MKRKISDLMLGSFLALFSVGNAYGGVPTELTDQQLDQISAGGLNFDFDAMLGSASTISDNMSKAQIYDPNTVNQNALSVNPNSTVKVISPIAPIAPSMPTNPETIVPIAPLSPQDVAQVSPVTPPTIPQVAHTIDLMATLGQGKNIEVLSNSSGMSAMPLSSSGAINSIDLSGMAQQNLSAMVSVNAAGSIVPVQINMTVIMNSTVESLTNSNTLSVNNFTTVRMQ